MTDEEMTLIVSGLAWIEPAADGTFGFSADPGVGLWARMIPIIEGEEIVDVVAWERGAPSPWWLLRGNVTHLGRHAADLACASGRPLTLTATPERYLDYHAGHALCVVNWSADLRAIFEGVREIRCETPALARRLNAGLRDQAGRAEFDVKVA
jgi:hypothetical protein